MSRTITSREWNDRANVVGHVKKGAERALYIASQLQGRKEFEVQIAMIDAPIQSALELGEDERVMYQEFRSFQLTLDFICDELYPKDLPEYNFKLNAFHIGVIRGMLSKHRDENPETHDAITALLDPQIERQFYSKRDK